VRPLFCLLLAQLCILAQTTQDTNGPAASNPEIEAKALELLREKTAEFDKTNAPVVEPAPTTGAPSSPRARSAAQTNPATLVKTNAVDKMKAPPPTFEDWPQPAASPGPILILPAPLPPAAVPPPPQPQKTSEIPGPTEHARGKALYSFRAEELDLKAAL